MIKNFIASKKLGQNFLINPNICIQIDKNVDYTNVDCIIEIGPGMGALTTYLIKHNIQYYGIELDKRLYEYCLTNIKGDNIIFVNDDILKFDLSIITNKYKNCIIITNVPYSISSLVLLKFIKSNVNIMYIMLQKEMVDRILAKPKTKQYNNFTVLFNTYSIVERILNVSKNNFNPIPQVDSVVIKIIKNNNIYDENFDNFVKFIFLNKRKTLVNNLLNNYDKIKILNILNDLKINPKARAEELDLNTIKSLYLNLNK